MKEVFIVMACSGSWDDYAENPVNAYSTLDLAQEEVTKLTEGLEDFNNEATRQQELWDKEHDEAEQGYEGRMEQAEAEGLYDKLNAKYPQAFHSYNLIHTYLVRGPIPFIQ